MKSGCQGIGEGFLSGQLLGQLEHGFFFFSRVAYLAHCFRECRVLR